MLPDERTTRSDVTASPGQLEGLVVAGGRERARPLLAFLRAEKLNLQLVTEAELAFEEALLHPPDVIVIDDGVRPAGGIELCQRLKENTRTHFVPVVLWMQCEDRPMRLRAWAAGADAVFGPGQDEQERRTRLWALLRTYTLFRRRERKRREQGDVLANRRRWVSSFVHDLQSGIAALQANFEFLLARGENRAVERAQADGAGRLRAADAPDPDVGECVRDTRALFSDLTRGLRTVLDYERWETGRLEHAPSRVALGPLLNDLVVELRELAAANGKGFMAMLQAGQAEIEVDVRLLRVAIFNLVAHVLRQPMNAHASLRVESTMTTVRFEISGDGESLDGLDLEALFEPYGRSARHAPAGHGVGLALARAVIEEHARQLTLQPVPRRPETRPTPNPGPAQPYAFVFEFERAPMVSIGRQSK